MNLKAFLRKSREKRRGKCLYLTDSLETEITEKTDIILSPHFYWIKREEFPVKNRKEAQKFAPSVFDSLIEDIENYKFIVLDSEKEGEFIFLAYSVTAIFEKLREKFKIKDDVIGDLYLAQSEFNEIDEPLSVNRNLMLVRIDGIVSEIRNSSQQDQTPIYVTGFIRKHDRTKHKLKVTGLNGDLTLFQKISLLSIPVVASLLLFINNSSLQDSLQKLDSEIESKRDIYNLPATSFELKSIKNRLQKIDGEQSRLRSDIAWFEKKKFSHYGEIISLKLDSKEVSVKFRLKKGSDSNRVKAIFQKRDREADINQEENLLIVSFKR